MGRVGVRDLRFVLVTGGKKEGVCPLLRLPVGTDCDKMLLRLERYLWLLWEDGWERQAGIRRGWCYFDGCVPGKGTVRNVWGCSLWRRRAAGLERLE